MVICHPGLGLKKLNQASRHSFAVMPVTRSPPRNFDTIRVEDLSISTSEFLSCFQKNCKTNALHNFKEKFHSTSLLFSSPFEICLPYNVKVNENIYKHDLSSNFELRCYIYIL